MAWLADYGLFFAKVVTLVIAILIVVAGILALMHKNPKKERGKIQIQKLNRKYRELKQQVEQELFSKKQLKESVKRLKKELKLEEKAAEDNPRKRIFVLNFNGDIRASQVECLREEVTAILTTATRADEVVICIESPGGMMHTYGLCASQLARIRERQIPLTVIIDKVAASGGYMMAAVANQIIAAPFAIIGSIGVVAQLPNFHRFLKAHRVDYELMTAGEYKRTLTLFGDNDNKARRKLQEELDESHQLFKNFIQQNRAILDMDKVATGEHWLGTRAYELKLIDKLGTSDDYLLEASETADVYAVTFKRKDKLPAKLAQAMQKGMDKLLLSQTHDITM